MSDNYQQGWHDGTFTCPNCAREKQRADEAFIRGASWAYGELTGAIIVPASFEELARDALAPEHNEPAASPQKSDK